MGLAANMTASCAAFITVVTHCCTTSESYTRAMMFIISNYTDITMPGLKKRIIITTGRIVYLTE